MRHALKSATEGAHIMNIEYAIDRLYDAGWTPQGDADVETLADGRPFPSLESIHHEFECAGLALTIAHNPQFHCYRATWNPLPDRTAGEAEQPPVRQGTVIGACEREAAVYALAILRAAYVKAPALELSPA
jgi:hypothetical protein